MINAQHFLDFANNMQRNNETDDRVCISRAYYAAMHKALDYAVREGYSYNPGEAGGTHNNLIFYYEKQGNDGLLISEILRKLKRLREHADYRLCESVHSIHAKKALEMAKTIFTSL